jgi:hypothetical protein
MLKIEVETHGSVRLIRLIGRIRVEHIEVLESELAGAAGPAKLNLHEVTLVDLAAIRFLLTCENKGVLLIDCSPYIREWIARERGA